MFVGDTLFAMGCGRLFEGDAATMWNSIQKIMALPKETDVYCAHEYTLTNARFAATVEPENAALIARLAEVEAARAAGNPDGAHDGREGTRDESVLQTEERRVEEGDRNGEGGRRGGVRGDT